MYYQLQVLYSIMLCSGIITSQNVSIQLQPMCLPIKDINCMCEIANQEWGFENVFLCEAIAFFRFKSFTPHAENLLLNESRNGLIHLFRYSIYKQLLLGIDAFMKKVGLFDSLFITWFMFYFSNWRNMSYNFFVMTYWHDTAQKLSRQFLTE